MSSFSLEKQKKILRFVHSWTAYSTYILESNDKLTMYVCMYLLGEMCGGLQGTPLLPNISYWEIG